MDIIVYSTDCPKCKVLKKKLSENGIAFREVANIKQMMELGITAVPVLSVDGVLMEFGAANAWINGYREGAGLSDAN